MSDDVTVVSVIFGGLGNGDNYANRYTHWHGINDSKCKSLSDKKLTFKSPIELTLVDTNLIDRKKLHKTNNGTIYQVTDVMPRKDSVQFVSKEGSRPDISKDGNGLSEDIANKIYDRIEKGFQIGEPVWIPNNASSIIKSTSSDLKYGYYRD